MLQMQCNSFTVKPIDKLKRNTYVPCNQSANQTEKSGRKISGYVQYRNFCCARLPDPKIIEKFYLPSSSFSHFSLPPFNIGGFLAPARFPFPFPIK